MNWVMLWTLVVFAAKIVLPVSLFIWIFVYRVPSNHGAVISIFERPTWSHGAGYGLLMPALMKVYKTVSVTPRNQILEGNFETKAKDGTKDIVKLKVGFDYVPSTRFLASFVRYEKEEELQQAIKETLRAILSDRVEDYESHAEVANQIAQLSEDVRSRFEQSTVVIEESRLFHPLLGFTIKILEWFMEIVLRRPTAPSEPTTIKLQEYYGIDLQRVFISDPELPKEEIEASAHRKAQGELNKAKEAEAESINRIRANEMAEMNKIARELVTEAKKHGQVLSFEEALKITQVQFGKAKEEIHHIRFDDNTARSITGALGAILGGRIRGR